MTYSASPNPTLPDRWLRANHDEIDAGVEPAWLPVLACGLVILAMPIVLAWLVVTGALDAIRRLRKPQERRSGGGPIPRYPPTAPWP